VFFTPVRLWETRQTATFRSTGARKAQVFGEGGRTKRASIPTEKLITPMTCTESVIS
jgi:hypothetical protein